MSTIKRKAIKIRKPIHKEFCSCWNTKVFSADGIPYLTVADHTSVELLKEMLEEVSQATGFYLSASYEDYELKAMTILEKKLPVTVYTNRVLSDDLLKAMSEVPHSAVHADMNFLEDDLRNRLDPTASSIMDMRAMMFNCKSWKIFTVLCVSYQPHLVSKFDLYEMIDMIKNQVAHLVLSFPSIDDSEFYSTFKAKWESIKPSSIDLFRQYFTPEVTMRSWEVRPKYKKDITRELLAYTKTKKIGMEVLENHESDNRIRHHMSGMAPLPLGIRPFWYGKVNGQFEKVDAMPDQECPRCQKGIFS